MDALKKIILASFFSAMLLAPALVFADSFGAEEAARIGGLGKDKVSLSGKTVPEVIGDIVGVVLSLLGVVFFLLILYAGIMWMTAFGVADKAEKSKEILIQASVGLIIVLSAYAISSFVFDRLGAGGETANNTGYCSDADGTCKAICADNESVWATPYECAPQSCCVPD